MRSCISAVLLSVIMSLNADSTFADEFAVTCNSSGYVVTPRGNPPLYLGEACDAYNDQLGSGSWCWQEDGVAVEFARGGSFIDGLSIPSCPSMGRRVPICGCSGGQGRDGTGRAALSTAAASAVARRHVAFGRDLSGLSYSNARSVILKRLWEPFQNPAPGELALVARDIYDQGYVEVGVCSPVGDVPCKFYFRNANGHYLEVSTSGENPHVEQVAVLDAEAFAEVRSVLWSE